MRTDGMTRASLACLVVLLCAGSVRAQTVNVRFRYQPQGTYARVHFPGQINNWGPNSNGTISAGAPSQADSIEASTGLWVKTIPMTFGAWQYKIYRQLSSNPTDWSWIPDPLNRIVLPPDQNSQFVVDSLVLFQLCPIPYTIETGGAGTLFVVKSGLPRLSAGIFQPPAAPKLTVNAFVDGTPVPNAIMYYDSATGIFTYRPLATIPDGMHTFKLIVAAGSQSRVDSVSFEVSARPVQIQTPTFTTHKPKYITAGFILKGDGSSLDSATTMASISVNGVPKSLAITNGQFADSTALVDGVNIIKVTTANGSDSVVVTRIVSHTPFAVASIAFATTTIIQLSASSSTEPDGQPLTFRWFEDPANPLGLSGVSGSSPQINRPTNPGEYTYGVIATDPDNNSDTTRSYFVIKADGSLEGATIASHPQWASKARVYFLFPKAFSQTGTLNAAALRLQNIKDMGFNVIWLMPVMKNDFPINQNFAPGYRIVDFYTIAPEYGTNDDFRNFVNQAHALGIKVILDVTPNHTSRFHPWSANAHALRQNSPYWNWYQHASIPHNTNGLGQSADADGFWYYSGFSSGLLNLNWTDVDAQAEMIKALSYWVKVFGVDGYRFDVYWGPHRRYGEAYMGKPVRDALKHIKPDILLLGEDDGTGSGTETIYADYVSLGINSGLDAAYDFKLYFNQIRGFGFNPTAINSLHSDIDNGGFYPGKNSLYMRFMESQDEDRITYFYSSSGALDAQTTFMRTMPMASVIFTAPGFPMIWNGQEVGWGYGIGGPVKEPRNRSTINWDYQGKDLLSPHYQKLANIRGQFEAFTQHKQDTNNDGQVNASDAPDFVRVSSSNDIVYAFTRPYTNQNGLTAVNFASSDQVAMLDLTGAGVLSFSGGIQPATSYYVNNLYNNSRQVVQGSALDSVIVSLSAYGTAIYTVSTTIDSVVIVNPITAVKQSSPVPTEFALAQNYPNPFNPSTTIRLDLPLAGRVSVKIYDMLGREIVQLVDNEMGAGSYTSTWDGRNANGLHVGSGVYLYRLTLNEMGGRSFVLAKKMVLVR